MNDLRRALVGAVGVVYVVAVDELDQVGVLLDRARLANPRKSNRCPFIDPGFCVRGWHGGLAGRAT